MSRETIAVEHPREWLDLIFTLHKEIPPHRKAELRESWDDFKYVYLSHRRPLEMVRAKDLGATGEVRFFNCFANTKTLVFSREPLPVDRLDAYELLPFTARTMGRYIIDYAAEIGTPVELKRRDPPRTGPRPRGADRDRERAVVLFKNPRGAWQLSDFTEGLGPTGHQEERGDDPAQMVGEAWQSGYRDFSPGIIDAIMSTVDE